MGVKQKILPRHDKQIIGRQLAIQSKSCGYLQDVAIANIYSNVAKHFSESEKREIFGNKNSVEEEKKLLQKMDRLISITGDQELKNAWSEYKQTKHSIDLDYKQLSNDVNIFVNKAMFVSSYLAEKQDNNVEKNIEKLNYQLFLKYSANNKDNREKEKAMIDINKLRLRYYTFIFKLMQNTDLADYTITNEDYYYANTLNPHLQSETKDQAFSREMDKFDRSGQSFDNSMQDDSNSDDEMS